MTRKATTHLDLSRRLALVALTASGCWALACSGPAESTAELEQPASVADAGGSDDLTASLDPFGSSAPALRSDPPSLEGIVCPDEQEQLAYKAEQLAGCQYTWEGDADSCSAEWTCPDGSGLSMTFQRLPVCEPDNLDWPNCGSTLSCFNSTDVPMAGRPFSGQSDVWGPYDTEPCPLASEAAALPLACLGMTCTRVE